MQGPQGPTKLHPCLAWRQLCTGPLDRDASARVQQSQGMGRLNLGFSLRERGSEAFRLTALLSALGARG